MAKKKVYVCFDYDRDKHYKYLMEAWNANPNFEFLFNDKSPREIQSYNISVIKSCLTKKIKEANEFKITNSKLYRTIGTITGIMIVVIFI